MSHYWRPILFVLVFSLTLVSGAHAGGLYLYEVGSPDVGLAGAGYAARADDAATVFTNPAGMTRLDQPSLMMGAQPMYLHIDFNPDGSTSADNVTLPGGGVADSGDTNGWMPAGGLYYVHPVNDRLRVGMALNGYFGLALDYEDDWVGRYYVQEATLQAAAIQPAVAWKVNDWLSLGAGVAALYGTLEEKIAVNNLAPALADGKLKVSDEDWTAQFNLGVLIEPQKGTRFGLTYLSEADLDFSDRVEFSGLGPGLSTALGNRGLLNAKLDLGITMPQAVMLSVYHEFTDRLALMANLGWQDWSRFGQVDVSVDADNDTSLTTELDYKDTWHVALGVEYQVADAWQLTGGVAYDSAMMDEDDVTPALPTSDSWRFGLGTRYDWSKDVTLSGAYELVWMGDIDMTVNRGPLAGQVSGTYEDTSIHVLCLTMEWRF
ncbi:MAG: transporter [Desulfobacteraceae bacterium]|nr:transporter [Desulfobacteraceae bacterium]MBC2751934.1 transporter [Desulfobacteraceae bacterium]